MLELLGKDLVLLVKESIIPLLENLNHNHLLLQELLLVTCNVFMMKLFPFLLGVPDAVEKLVVRLLLEFKLRH